MNKFIQHLWSLPPEGTSYDQRCDFVIFVLIKERYDAYQIKALMWPVLRQEDIEMRYLRLEQYLKRKASESE